MQPTVTSLDGDAGLSLYDPTENARFVLYTDRPIEPRPADPGAFAFPVETAVAVETAELVVPKRGAIHVREPDGSHRAEFTGREGERYGADAAGLLDVSSTAMKLYLAVPGPFEIVCRPGERNTVISLADPRELVVGVRSFHERPAHTVRTPAEPEAVMQALSATGSALKTLSCERSYPTLRGHPPAFEVADELSIPAPLEPPETGVTIWVPPTWEFVYPVAPLVYYLGATLRPGGPPCIEVGDWSFSLGGPGVDPDAFQRRVARALQQVFFVDCLARTEGLYPVDLHERTVLEDALDFDPRKLYDAPLETRVRTFLDLPYEPIAAHLPTWHLCVDVEPTADHVAALPYLLDDLALIRCRLPREPASPDPELDAALEAFTRSMDRTEDAPTGDGRPPGDVFTPEPAPAMEQAYLGESLPFRRNKLSLDVLERRLAYDEPAAGNIDVRIVCNDERMADETAVEEYYGVHDLVQYSVDIEYDLTRAELADALGEEVDMLHYVGHVDDDGFACADGHFDASDLDEVGVDTFLLNACNSYDQGRALLDAGAKAGVTSLTEVGNDAANRLGQTLARALNAGFTLRSAFALTSLATSGVYYLVLGDGGRQLVQCQSGVPYLIDVVDADFDEERVSVDLYTFPANSRGQGTIWSPSLVARAGTYLPFGRLDRFTATIDELVNYLRTQPFPLTADGNLYWSNELSREQTVQILSEVEALRAGDGAPARVADFFEPLRGEQ